MSAYLEFQMVQCKDCYKCLRECPVKAIDVKDHHAKIIEDHCILCGHCTQVCPQNAKIVHSEISNVRDLLASGARVAASIAPSFISSLNQSDFSILRIALAKLGFSVAEETAVGAQAIVEEYKKILTEIILSKIRSLKDTEPYTRYAKVMRHATSKGFESDAIAKLLSECGENAQNE